MTDHMLRLLGLDPLLTVITLIALAYCASVVILIVIGACPTDPKP